MKKKPDKSPGAELRRQAEAKLSKPKKRDAAPPATESNTRRLIDELKVHQIELEMQNEELVKARAEKEALLRQYTDLYDFAPVGYFTLARDGAIHQVNLAGAKLLGVERGALIKRRFGLFVSVESRPTFNAFLEKVFSTSGSNETCEVILLKDGSAPFWALIEATASDGSHECKIAVVDITDRKIAEEKIKMSEEYFREMTENSSDIILVVNKKGSIIYASPSVESYIGYKSGEMIGQSCLKFIHPADIPRAILDYRKAVLSKDRSISNSFRVLHKDGSEHILEGFGKNLLNHPIVSGFLMNVHDITERNKAEEALRLQVEITKNLSEGAFLTRYYDGIILYTNPKFEEMFGYAPGEMVGKHVSIVNAATDKSPEETAREIMEILHETGEWHGEVKNIKKDGTHFWCYANVSMFDHPNYGKIQVAVHTDITERKLAEDTILQEHTLLRTLIDNLPNGIFVKDKEYRKIIANPIHTEGVLGHLKYLGINPDINIINKTDFEVFPKELAEKFFSDDQKIIRDGHSIINNVEFGFQPDGKKIWFLTSKVPLRDKDGSIIGMIGITNDITERKLAEEKIKHLNRVLLAIRKVNQLIIKEKDRDRLIKRVCEDLVATRGYFNTWIVLLDDSGKYLTSTEVDLGKDFLPMIELIKSGKIIACGKNALKKSAIVITENPPNACKDCPLSGKYSNRSAMTIRLEYEGKIFGLASVSIPKELIKDEEEHNLFKEITEDIAFALHSIEVEKKRKQAEEALRTNEAQLSNAMVIAKLGYWEYDVADDLFTFNDHFYDIFHTTAKKVGGYKMTPTQYAERFLHPDDQKLVAEEMKKAFETTDPNFSRTLEHRIIYADGEVGYISVRFFVVKDEQGRTIKTYGANQDITEHKRAEEALQSIKKRMETLMKASPTVIYTSKVTGDYAATYISDNIESVFGYLPQEFLSYGGFWADHIHPDDKERIFDGLADILKKGSILHEYRFKHKNGTYRWVTDELKVEYDEKKQPVEIQGFISDITERKQAEEALRTSAAQLSIAMEISKLGYWEYDVADDLFTFNDHFYNIFHTTAEKVGGYKMTPAQYAERFLHPDDSAVVANEMKKAFETTDPNFSRTLEHRIIYADGKVGYISVHFFVVKDEQGRTIKTYGANQDITERKKVEEELKSAHEYTRNLIDSSLDMIIAVDKERRIVEFNMAAQATFGYAKAEVLGKHIDILYADPAEGLKTHAITRSTGRFSAEIMNKRKNGELFPAFLSASILHDTSGKFLGIMGVSRDITKVKQAEKEKESLQMQLLQSQKLEAIGTLAGGIAHDFNNLLTIILGHSQLASGRLDEGNPIRTDLEKIIGAGERAAILTRQLLIFSRKQVLEPKALDLNVVITDVGKLFKRLIGEDIKIIPVLEPGLYQIKADQNQIEQVLMNLIVNARDAMPKGGTIRIQTQNVTLDKDISKTVPESVPGKFVRLTVEDAGIGMDEEIKKHLFEPFFTTKKDGTGLGLAVVYGIAKQHNGWINIYSELKHGSTFKVYLPAFIATPEEEVEKTVSLASLQGNGERILLVEDEENVRQFASAALREYSYIIFEVGCGKDAQRIFDNENGNFDLIFSDVVLPDKDGLQLVDELLKVKPDLRILLSSGYSDYKSQWDTIKNRKILFLQKPYGITDLLKSIKELFQTNEG